VKSALSPAQRRGITFQLLSTKLYETGNMTSDEKWARHREFSTKNVDLRMLAEAGWDQAQLDVGGRQTTAMKIYAEACAKVASSFTAAGRNGRS
jgi:hypothetical protein